MKLASLNSGRDGRLVVVNENLTAAAPVPKFPTLQAALDSWSLAEPVLREIARGLQTGRLPSVRFEEADCASPLPRAFQFLDGSAFVNHVELVRRARGATMPDAFWSDPLMYQGGSDQLTGPHAEITGLREEWGIDFEAEIGVIVDDVSAGCDRAEAAAAIRLLVLINDVSLRDLIPVEVAKGFGFLQSKPPSALSPVAVTPDELGEHWDGGRLHLALRSTLNGRLFGRPDAGSAMIFDFPDLIVHAARTRPLGAGTIIGSGTVSNRGPKDTPGRRVDDGGVGYSCILEQRIVEQLSSATVRTPFLRDNDEVRIEMWLPTGASIFGAIAQRLRAVA